MTMRIGVDARLLNVSHIRGTGRYIYELLRHTEAADGVEWTVYGHDPSRPVHVPPGLRGSVEVFGMRGHRFNLWEQIALPWRVRGKLDVLHCADNTAPLLQPMPTVVTIPPPWVPGFMVTPSRIRQSAPTVSVEGSPLYLRSCGW